MAVSPHAVLFRLFDDLGQVISTDSLLAIMRGQVDWPGMTYRERAASSIAHSLLRKWEGSLNEKTKASALLKFKKVNSDCLNWSYTTERFEDDFLLTECKNSIWRFWHRNGQPIVDHHNELLERGAHGPGSAIGSAGGDFYTKLFSSKMAVTSPSLYFWYKRYIRGFPEWSHAEKIRCENYGEPDIVKGNRLDFVPKNDDISRSICVEPSLNMFYQLGLGAILTSRLEEVFGISLDFQQFKNRELARRGSLDGSFDTIDLSSASDSISLKMLKWLLPPDFFRWLVALRSPSSKLPDGTLQELHMVSTMGNGYTFPLQTIIFSCVVMSAFRLRGLAPSYPFGVSEGNFGVNGDDIVVPREITSLVLRLLHLLGFTINNDKTFVEGPFRESCGGDYFNGRNLRGVYIRKLSEPQDFYSVINQLNLFSTRTGIPLSKTVRFLLNKVKFRPVPIWENDDAGVKLPYSLLGQMKVDRDTQSIIYSAWTPRPAPLLRISEDRLLAPKSYKPRIFNPSGLWIGILQGSVNPLGIPLLPKRVPYRAKTRIASNWDTPLVSDIRAIQLYSGWFVFERWKTALYRNLYGF